MGLIVVEVGGTGASARHGVPAKTAHQCRFYASTLPLGGTHVTHAAATKRLQRGFNSLAVTFSRF